jgi:plasmid stabilization system protein ParE
MSRALHILGRAQADVDDIFNWLVHRSVQGAISWYFAFGRAVEGIAASPETFGEAPESGLLGRELRHALFKTRRGRVYRIVFEFSDANIILLRVRGPGQSRLRRGDLPKA